MTSNSKASLNWFQFFKSKPWLPLVISIVFVAIRVAYFFEDLRYTLDADTMSYIETAQHYAKGEFWEAINSYWSPMSCWGTAIFLKLGMEIRLAVMMQGIISAVLFLYACWKIFRRWNMNLLWLWSMLGAIAFAISTYVYIQPFNDIFAAAFFIIFIQRITDETKPKTTRNMVKTGIVAALTCFSKAYYLPAIILILTLRFIFIRAIVSRKILKLWGVFFLTWALILSPWVLLQHQKFDYWGLSSAGTFNIKVFQHGRLHYQKQYPYIVPPVHSTCTNYWEDPFVSFDRDPDRYTYPEPFLIKQFLHVYKGTWILFKFNIDRLFHYSLYLWYAAALSLLIFPFFRRLSNILKQAILILIFYPLGYFFVHIELRFLWPLLPFIIFLIYSLVVRFKKPWADLLSIPSIIFCFLSVVHYPKGQLDYSKDQGKEWYQTAMQIKGLNLKGGFASNARGSSSYGMATALAFYNQLSYFSPTYEAEPNYEQLIHEMRRLDVNYYFYFTKENADSVFLIQNEKSQKLTEISNGAVEGLKIFRLKP